jgi:hypothetical protein
MGEERRYIVRNEKEAAACIQKIIGPESIVTCFTDSITPTAHTFFWVMTEYGNEGSIHVIEGTVDGVIPRNQIKERLWMTSKRLISIWIG